MFLTHLLLRRLKRIFTLIEQLCSETKIRRKDVTLRLLQLRQIECCISILLVRGSMNAPVLNVTDSTSQGGIPQLTGMNVEWKASSGLNYCPLGPGVSALPVEIDYRINPICQYYWKGSLPSPSNLPLGPVSTPLPALPAPLWPGWQEHSNWSPSYSSTVSSPCGRQSYPLKA